MPSSIRVQTEIIALSKQLPLGARPRIVELGSGWGNLGLGISRALPRAAVVGYENSRVPLWFSRIAKLIFRATNLRLVRADFYETALREEDLVLCYLSPEAMTRLQMKFSAELKPGAFVVSSTFALPEWKAEHVVRADDFYRTPIYVYRAGGA